MIYLDSAATSLLKPKSVACAVSQAVRTMASPGRGSHSAALRAADKVYECRELVCRLFDFDEPERVVFTMNATHALNIAIHSLIKSGDKVVISGYEHNSVTRPLYALGADVKTAQSELFNAEEALESFKALIPGADAVICNHVSNVFGFELPVYEIDAECAKYGVPFIIDASQSAGVTDIDMSRLKAAFVAMPGHKGLLGPQGTGVLLCARDVSPILSGGTGSDSINIAMPDFLPDRAEAGTHNVAGIAGLAEGLKYVMHLTPKRIGAYEKKLCRQMAGHLSNVPGLEVFSTENGTQAGVLSVRHESISSELLCERLGKMGIAARCGLHCAPLAHKSAGTLESGTLRLSFSPFITQTQVQKAGRALQRIIVEEN